MHNALQQITLRCGDLTLSGFSIAGLATYLQVPELDVCFDMGECPVSAVPLRHVLLTHPHGDHARCLLRHRALRGMFGLDGEASYFMPRAIAGAFDALARADAAFEGVSADAFHAADVIALDDGPDLVALPHRKDTYVRAFSVDHRGVPSLGYTLYSRRKKLLPQYAGLPGPEIAKLRQRGVDVSATLDVPLITFIGDCVGQSLRDCAHIWDSPVLVIEASFVDAADRASAADKGHTHLDEIAEIVRAKDPASLPQHIVLKHFSMKCTRDEIVAAVDRAFAGPARARVQLLI